MHAWYLGYEFMFYVIIPSVCIDDITYRYKGELFDFAITLLLIVGDFLYLCSYMLNFLLYPFHNQENTKLKHAWYDLNVSR